MLDIMNAKSVHVKSINYLQFIVLASEIKSGICINLSLFGSSNSLPSKAINYIRHIKDVVPPKRKTRRHQIRLEFDLEAECARRKATQTSIESSFLNEIFE